MDRKGIKTGRRERQNRGPGRNAARRPEEDFRWMGPGEEDWDTEPYPEESPTNRTGSEKDNIRSDGTAAASRNRRDDWDMDPYPEESPTNRTGTKESNIRSDRTAAASRSRRDDNIRNSDTETREDQQRLESDRKRRESGLKTGRESAETDEIEWMEEEEWEESQADMESWGSEDKLDLEEYIEYIEDRDSEDDLEFEGDSNSRFRQEEARRAKKQRKPAGIRVRNAIVTALLTVVILITVGAVAFLFLQISGKNSLYSRADSSTLVSTLSEMAVTLGEEAQNGSEDSSQPDDMGNWQEGDIRYQGIHYRYNSDILTLLFLGIDKMGEVQTAENGLDGGQSDALFLLVLDPHKKKVSIIGIPRDTMTEVEARDESGNVSWNTTAQIALQHGYGDGGRLSCERSVKAVSKLFYGLPINGYCAINMGAIPVINDAVGGISLTALETLDFGNLRIQEGENIHLKGMDAYSYIHNRDINSFNSAGRRLQRQVQYLEAYAAAALETFKNDITFPVTLYGELSKYMVTDISVDEVGYLSTQVAGYGFSKEDMHTLKGETVMGETYEEFYADESALYELILKVFYEEVE